MVSTYNDNTKKVEAKTTRAGREAAKLTIDGTENLCGSQTARKVVRTEVVSGRTWDYLASDTDDDTINVAQNKRKRDEATTTSRKRRRTAADDFDASQERPVAPPQRKRKRDESSTDPDETFLKTARTQLKRTKSDDNSNAEILRFLRHIKLPSSRRIRHEYPGGELTAGETEAYVLSEQDARRLLASSESITAPVFVLGGGTSTSGIVEIGSDRRPMDLMFDWFSDDADKYEGRVGTEMVIKTVTQLRRRFLSTSPSGPLWNFPDLPFPASMPVPAFLHQPSCKLLSDVVRYLLDTPKNKLCTDACTRRKAPGRTCMAHTLTLPEYDEMQQNWNFWQGTVMMAEAGAVSTSHCDQWGLGTHISVLEGEMGFGYLPNPTQQDLDDVVQAIKPDDRWRYKVLRPGDALYMGPGTPHLVFRLPEGKQTLGLAGHLVRGVDAERWVKLMQDYCQAAAKNRHDVLNWPSMVRALAIGLRYVQEHRMSQKHRQAFYGGSKQIAKFDKALKQLELFVKRLP